MESGRSHKAKKGKDIMAESSGHGGNNNKRGDNWRYHETTNLINAIEEVHDRRKKDGFSFNAVEQQEIYNLFMQKTPDSTQEKDKIVNRIKVVLKMFRICDALAKLSGGGWDDTTHRPIAASEKDYEEMVKAQGESARFLLRNNFPWYRQMEAMVGGQTATGGRLHESFVGSQPTEPIHRLMNQQMTINVSEQGSSDDPEDINPTAEPYEEETQQPTRGAARSSTDRGQSCDGGFPRSRNGGSKRTSTDEGSEPNVRGKRLKERNRKKEGDGKLIANAGHDIANSMRDETKAFVAKSEEIQTAIAKLKELDVEEEEYEYLLDLIESDLKRQWFLFNDKETILRIIRRKMRPKRSESNPRASPHEFYGFYQGFPHPNPPSNTSSSQFCPPTNPAASNFYFENNRDGSFM